MSLKVTKNYFTVNGKSTKRKWDAAGLPRCSRHNEYKAVRFPTTGCPHCVSKWDAVHGTDELSKLVGSKKTKTKSKKKSKKKKSKLVNHIAICIDRSSSMCSFTQVLKENLIRTVESLKKASDDSGQETTLTLIDFSHFDTANFVKVPISEAVGLVKQYKYDPYGATALYDAVNKAITSFELTDNGSYDTSYLVITLTDGEENRSSVSSPYLSKKIRELQGTDRWTFTFQVPLSSNGAYSYKTRLCRRLSVPEGNVVEWETTRVGFETVSKTTSVASTNYFASRSVGQTSTTSFYTDLSKVKQKDLNKLDDVKTKVRIFSVKKECDIRDFLNKENNGFKKGSAYYQLTKTEPKVQPYKKIMIMEKGKKSVYTGDQARNLLGLPLNETVRLKPGNHANYDVFIQSTSANRKLVRGTKLIYVKDSHVL